MGAKNFIEFGFNIYSFQAFGLEAGIRKFPFLNLFNKKLEENFFHFGNPCGPVVRLISVGRALKAGKCLFKGKKEKEKKLLLK